MRRFFSRFRNLFRSRQAESEMTREIASHLALLAEDFERRGLSPREAALAARRAYGGVEQAKELHREARSFLWIEQFLKDVRYAARNLFRNPGFTLLAALALALGIGANATIFGIYNTVALKQLPVADPARVVRVKRFLRNMNGYRFAYTEYQYLRDRNSVFSDLVAASSEIPVLASIAGAGAPEHLTGYAVSANYFAGLGVNARLGRTFLPDEDRATGANTVVVLGYRFWQRKFYGDPDVIGRTIKLNGMAYTIVGVAPPQFTSTDVLPTESGFWAPLSMIEQLNPAFGAGWRDKWRDAWQNAGFELLARLDPGVSRAKAQAETDLLLRGYLSGLRESLPTTAVTLERTSYLGSTGDVGFQVFAAAVLVTVSLVLLVACANVANMLLARGVSRRRAIGIRMALGATRLRLILQLLTESVLLALLGGAAGILLSAWAGRVLWTALSGIVLAFRGLRIELDLSPDSHVLLYGLALSVLTGIVSGLAPALQSTRLDLGAGPGRSRLRGLLLGAQVTVSVLLLVVSGALMGGVASSFVNSADLGFETHNTYRLRVSTRDAGMLPRLRDRLETLPELSRVSIGGAPLAETIGLAGSAGNWNGQTQTSFASDGYFETLGIPLERGRGFTRPESDRGAPVAVISESTARRLWPGQDPLGQYIHFARTFITATEYEVAGVAKDVRFTNLTEVDPMHVYLPTGAMPRLFGGVVFRIRARREKALAAVTSAVESVDPALLPSLDLVSLEEGPVAVRRSFYRVLGGFAGVLTLLSLTLAAIGVYGVMAFLVSQRTREIGIRMALGATSRAVLMSVVVQGLRPVLAGMLVGMAASAGLLAILAARGVVSSSGPFPATFGAAALYAELALMLATAVLASIVPARRALRVDPVVALRHE